ncbi:MAG: histidinol-phosphate transaminase [Clostridia bacterium]|nr:histidinol-phosphate transaminase [Clostridia bacterium]
MSRFFSGRFAALTPYTPGEQPRDRRYVKLNTNESPFDPPERVAEAAKEAARDFRLYPDPTCRALSEALFEAEGIEPERVVWGNGSDELLNFAFMAYCDEKTPAVFPDVTYGFYAVFAAVNRVPAAVVPLLPDLSMDLGSLRKTPGTLFLANPNAPTGIALPPRAIEDLLRADPDRMVVVDEAYVDFGAETVAPLTKRYDNLLVIRTFSKSRSMAGARLGFAVGCPSLIGDLETLRYSNNPYNVDHVAMAAGIAMLKEEKIVRERCREVASLRDETAAALRKLGFEGPASSANFLFVRHPALPGDSLYRSQKEKGVLVRHFDSPRIRDYNRVTVGSRADMKILLDTISAVLEERA